MPFYKDLNNKLHWLDRESDNNLLPVGSVKITKKEADTIRQAGNNPPLTIDEIWKLIEAEQDRRMNGGIRIDNKWFHSDIKSRVLYFGLKDIAGNLLDAGGVPTDDIVIRGKKVKWKACDKSFIYITIQLAFEIVTAISELDIELFVTAENHKTAMEASSDPGNYDFSENWPPMFEG